MPMPPPTGCSIQPMPNRNLLSSGLYLYKKHPPPHGRVRVTDDLLREKLQCHQNVTGS